MPKLQLDGELWSARSDFDAMGVVRRKDAITNAWAGITFMVFDCVDKNIRSKPFNARYQ